MLEFTLSSIAPRLNGRCCGGDARFSKVSTDTRTLQPGDLFIALHGPNFDGHQYARIALERGACGALVDAPVAVELPQLQVGDTLRALGQLARIWRERAQALVVAITGSNGKTTLRAMLAAILQRVGNVLATQGNLNNEIGLPLTLLRLQDEAYAVVELGANHPGEIGYLSEIAQPDVAILNNAGRAHLEGFGSPEGVARAKVEIINGLRADGVFVFNADDRFAPLWQGMASGRQTYSFGVKQPADVTSDSDDDELIWGDATFQYRFRVNTHVGSADVSLQLAGAHNRMNALAAVAAALSLGVGLEDIRAGLATVPPVPGRLFPLPGQAGSRLVDDSYNANPDSVDAAIAVLSSAPGRKTLVLGDLAELGVGADALHRELGERAFRAGIDRWYSCGRLSANAAAGFGHRARHFPDQEGLIEALRIDISERDTILIKGSRTARMDRVVTALREAPVTC